MAKTLRIAVFGAGSVGCYVGGRLLAAGGDVVLIGRPRLADILAEHPLRVSDLTGFSAEILPGAIPFVTDASAAADADLVLVCVKSAATLAAAEALRPHLPPNIPVVSLQNGISNAAELQRILSGNPVLAGMVPFNILQKAPGHFHQGTDGHLMAGAHPVVTQAQPLFEEAGLPLEAREDMPRVLWSKLLLNLNNPLNALAGIPLKEELSQRAWRQCLGMAQRETLQLLKRAGIPTVRLTPLPMPLLPWLMGVPDFLFRRLASNMVAMDPIARSSMWEDLEAGRKTEVDYINGEVVRLAESLGATAPINQALIQLIRDAEQNRPEPWSGKALLAHLRQVRAGAR